MISNGWVLRKEYFEHHSIKLDIHVIYIRNDVITVMLNNDIVILLILLLIHIDIDVLK